MARQLYSKDDRVLVKTGRYSWQPATVVSLEGSTRSPRVRYQTDVDRERGASGWNPRVMNTRAYILPLDSPEAQAILVQQAEQKRLNEEKDRSDAARREVIKAHRHNALAQRIDAINASYAFNAIERREKLLAILDEVLP